jgi:hypothetical protein
MTSYKITSENCTLGKLGSTVTEAELHDLNLQALLDGGHLEVVSSKQTKQTTTEGE